MSALDVAEHHLNEALSRLEQALAQRLASADPEHAASVTKLADERDTLHRDIKALREECERLNTALDAAESDRDGLRRTTDEVAAKLDNSIDELDRMIGE
jgi:septal ring factor EnvC (AmiA/AmiB activator)